MIVSSIKHGLKSLAYTSGLLGWWHRRRNADALTVFMFHRVLPQDTEAYSQAEREFTFSVDGFGRCLDFISRHYSVVSLADVESAVHGHGRLPVCPALITFDDGWRDTLVHAYPQLKAREMPALLFLATEILEAQSPQWWQDMLVQVLAQPELAVELFRQLDLLECYAHQRSRESDHTVAGKVAALPFTERLHLLSKFIESSASEIQMLTEDDVRTADRSYMEFGAHGHTHAPLTSLQQPDAELHRSYVLLNALSPAVPSMSFPHGAYTESILATSEATGFKLVFTSDPTLLDMKQSNSVKKIGRIHIPENEWTTEQGRISFPKLATFLFFRPRATH